MSAESMYWLNNYCLIGFTDKRGKAWHYRESEQGVEPNHYPNAIPIDDVLRRLFDWEAVQQFIYVPKLGVENEFVMVPHRKAITASDNGDVLGIFKEGYVPHQYRTWLLDSVTNILDADLGIGSALLLRNRAVAVVQVEVPDNIETPEGVTFRPNLLAATSFDGSLSTTYKRTVTVAVCDNTTEAALSEKGQQYKVKHSRHSNLRLSDAREALQVVYSIADDFSKELTKLCAEKVTDVQWKSVLDALVPVPEDDGRSRTVSINKRDRLISLWDRDERVAPWQNTAWGVVQAFNTYQQHYTTIRDTHHRAERNFDNVISGKTGASDHQVLNTLSHVLDKQLVSA